MVNWWGDPFGGFCEGVKSAWGAILGLLLAGMLGAMSLMGIFLPASLSLRGLGFFGRTWYLWLLAPFAAPIYLPFAVGGPFWLSLLILLGLLAIMIAVYAADERRPLLLLIYSLTITILGYIGLAEGFAWGEFVRLLAYLAALAGSIRLARFLHRRRIRILEADVEQARRERLNREIF